MYRVISLLLLALGLFCASAAQARDPALVIHLLDYIAVDYREAVSGGAVKDSGEYKEMEEFAANVAEQLAKLPDHPEKSKLLTQAADLGKLIAAKAPENDVAAAAMALREGVAIAYSVQFGPKRAPNLVRAASLYAEHCAGCHGARGRGDGAQATELDPRPSDFGDRERQRRRSVHGLFNTITLGVEGTAMRAFKEIPESDRWGLAYLAANWGATEREIQLGKANWTSAPPHDLFPSHAAVAGTTAIELEATHGASAVDVLAYLRSKPAVLDRGKPQPIAFARDKLSESVSLYADGRRDEAVQASLTAYLEGFELAEAALATVDAALLRRVEAQMIDYRNAMKSGVAAGEVQALARAIDVSLDEAQRAISGTALSAAAVVAASFVIFFREGLEAILIVTALFAFLKRGGQTRALRYLHLGWIAALVLGIVTWAVATWLIDVSGAGREATEGATALVASSMLLYVGFWLHDKSHAQAWQGFVMRGANTLGTGAAWGLAFMAFLAVYREVFETVLFYQALWTQAPGETSAIVAGFLAAAIALAAITWAMLRYSIRLPMGIFFGASAILLAALAVVLAGNGIAALQEAGMIPVSRVDFVTVSWLGIHPSVQSLAAQLVLATIVVALFGISRARSGRARSRAPAE